MTQYNLGFNHAGGFTGSTQINTTTTTTYGNRFQVLADGYISQLWFYTPYSSGNRIPQIISLWDAASGQRLYAKQPADTQGSGTGWHYTNIPNPIWVQANKTYIISAYIPGAAGAGSPWSYSLASNLPTPGAGLAWAIPLRAVFTGGDAMPNNTSNDSFYPLDVVFDTEYAPNPTAVATSGDIANNLAEWLSESDETHGADNMVKSTLTEVRDLADDEAGRYTIMEARMGFGTLAAAGTWMGQWLKDNLPTIAAVAGIAGDISTVLTNLGTPTSAEDIGTVVDNLRGAQLREEGRANIPVGDTGWVLQDDYDGSASHFYNQFADAYVLTWTDVSAPTTKQVVDGVDMVWARDHWACECRDGAVGRHFPLNGRVNDIRIPGSRMPGLLIHNPGGFPFNVQAWVYTG